MTSDAGTDKPARRARPARNPRWLPGYRMTVGANQSSKIRDYFLDVASTTICKKGPRTGRQPQGKQPLILRIDDFLSASVIVRIRIEHTKAKKYQSP